MWLSHRRGHPSRTDGHGLFSPWQRCRASQKRLLLAGTIVLNHRHPLHHRQLHHHHLLKAKQVEFYFMDSVHPGLEPVPLRTRRTLSPILGLLVAISYPPSSSSLSYCCTVESGSLKHTNVSQTPFQSRVTDDTLLRLGAGRGSGEIKAPGELTGAFRPLTSLSSSNLGVLVGAPAAILDYEVTLKMETHAKDGEKKAGRSWDITTSRHHGAVTATLDLGGNKALSY